MKTMGAYKSTLLYTSTRRQTTYIRIDNTHTLVQTAARVFHLPYSSIFIKDVLFLRAVCQQRLTSSVHFVIYYNYSTCITFITRVLEYNIGRTVRIARC